MPEALTPFYVDGDFSVAEPVGLPVFSSPVRSTTAEYTFTQEFMMERKSFRALPLNTPYSYGADFNPDMALYVLVSEGPRQDVGGGIVKWQRTYSRVPDSHDEFESYSYPFIGFEGVWTVGNSGSTVNATGRPRSSRIVVSRVHHDYFLTGPAPAPYLSPSTIPVIAAQRYFAGATPSPATGIEAEYIQDAFSIFPATVPSRTTYNAWTQHAIDLGFASGIAPDGDNPGQIVAEDSRLARWLGNIFLRQVRYVLAA